MSAALTMIAVVGHLEKRDGCTMKMLDIGNEIGRDSKYVTSIDDVRNVIAVFGAGVRAHHPGASFAIITTISKRDRKPQGFDDASRHGGLGQDAFLALRPPEAT